MSSAESWSAAAMTVQRLAVLLDAGVAPVAAFRAIAAAGATDAVVTRASAVTDNWELAAELRGALAAASEKERTAWAPVIAAWSVATQVGAPLAPTLARSAEMLRSFAASARAVDIALAGPVASARILLVLPIAGVLLGLLLGFDTARVLVATPPGWVCLGVGLALITAGGLWTRRLLRRARQRDPAPGVAHELLAIALAGGLGPDPAISAARGALESCELPTDLDGPTATIAFARRAGAPAGALLRAEAEEERRIAAADGERRAAALGVGLLLPLGICVLPAFLTLAVVPVVVALLGGTLAVL